MRKKIEKPRVIIKVGKHIKSFRKGVEISKFNASSLIFRFFLKAESKRKKRNTTKKRMVELCRPIEKF